MELIELNYKKPIKLIKKPHWLFSANFNGMKISQIAYQIIIGYKCDYDTWAYMNEFTYNIRQHHKGSLNTTFIDLGDNLYDLYNYMHSCNNYQFMLGTGEVIKYEDGVIREEWKLQNLLIQSCKFIESDESPTSPIILEINWKFS